MANIQVKALTEKTTLATSDWFLVQDAATDQYRKVRADNATPAGLPASRLFNNAKFDTYRNTTQTANATSSTLIVFTVENTDTGGNFNTATGRFTASVAGYYSFTAGVTVTVAAGDIYFVSLFKNGTEMRRGTAQVASATAACTYTVAGDFSLAVSDFIEVFFYNGSGGAKNVEAGQALTYFSGHIVSAT